MSTTKNAISDITAGKDKWTIVARVIRLWKTQAMDRSNLPFSLEMVLMDSKGDKIHASCKKTLVYKFDRILKEGNLYCFHHFAVVDNTGDYKCTRHKYKVNFFLDTRVNPVHGPNFTITPYQFVPISDILSDEFDESYLIDVIGIMTGVGMQKDLVVQGNVTKKNVIKIDSDGSSIDCALFGNYVDELNAFLASGDNATTVVVITLAKVKIFQGKKTLQNALHCTKILFNPDFPEAIDFKKGAIESNDCLSQGLSQLTDSVKISLEDEFTKVLERKSIEELRNCKERLTCVVLATITHIVYEENWWYYACKKCNRSVYQDEKSFFCENCNKHVINVSPRYRIRVGVFDYSGTANFVIFDRDGNDLFKKTCPDLIELQDNINDGSNCPAEISALVDKAFVFKVESNEGVNSRFDPSFRVKKMTSDSYIVQKFEGGDSMKSPGSVNVTKSKTVGLNLSAMYDVENDASCDLAIESQDDQIGISTGENFVELTPGKRLSEEILEDAVSGSTNAKGLKTIKLEKGS